MYLLAFNTTAALRDWRERYVFKNSHNEQRGRLLGMSMRERLNKATSCLQLLYCCNGAPAPALSAMPSHQPSADDAASQYTHTLVEVDGYRDAVGHHYRIM